MMTHSKLPSVTKEVIWDRVIPEPNSGCWLWEGPVFTRGYGQYKGQGAHRLSYQVYCGEIPRGMFVLHSCDQPSCCNPDHLRAGTNKENVRDMMKRGRAAVLDREKHHVSKLTASQVAAIRASDRSAKELAKEYGVTRPHIYKLRGGQHWPSKPSGGLKQTDELHSPL